MRRLRIAFKWLAIVVGSLLTAALLISALRSWRAGACLAEQLSSIRQAGDPVSLADLAREQVPPDRNAATFLRRAEKSLDAVSKELSPLGLNYDSYYEQGRPTEHGHLNERGAELVEGAISAYPDILPLLEQAAAAPDYVPDYDYTRPPEEFLEKYLPCTSQHRQVARFLQYRGDMLFAAQKREESLANGLVLLRLDRHFEREPMSIGYLVSCAIRSMAVGQVARAIENGPVSSALHDEVDAEISRHLESQAFVTMLKSERAYGIESFRNIRNINRGWVAEIFLWGWKQDECDYLKRMVDEIDLGTTPRYKAEAQLERMQAESKQARALTSHVIRSLEVAREAALRSRTRLQCLSVLNALSRLAGEPDGEKRRLDDLDLSGEIKVDPYTGQPLKIKHAGAGWVVYSVGGNLKDDGGNIEEGEDVGVGPDG